MKRFRDYVRHEPFMLTLLVVGAVAYLLVGCGTNGKFAGKDNPIDYAVSIDHACKALSGLNLTFRALSAAGKFDADQTAIGASAFAALNAFCDPAHPPTDFEGAIISLTTASVSLTTLIGQVTK